MRIFAEFARANEFLFAEDSRIKKNVWSVQLVSPKEWIKYKIFRVRILALLHNNRCQKRHKKKMANKFKLHLSKTPIESLKILLEWSNEQIIFGEMISSLGEERKKQVTIEIEKRLKEHKHGE